MNILHIAVHLGGGIGTVLRNWINSDNNNEHTVLLLNRNYYGEKQNNIHENLRYDYVKIRRYIKDSDVVLIHFWNHPLLFEFLINFSFPECRLCFWSHVSALYPPYVHINRLVKLSNKFVLSSPISNISDIEDTYKLDCVWTTGGIDRYLSVDRRLSKENFVVGYVGTLDYSKLHPGFVESCYRISKSVDNVKFVVCGDGKDEGIIKSEVNKLGLSDIFEFTGRVDVIDYIPTFNVFGYPLVNTHFGTCEQVIGEVLACGVQPVVLNNPSERFILESVGIIAENLDGYVNEIVDIANTEAHVRDPEELRELAIELYDLNKMITTWYAIFNDVIREPKTERSWNSTLTGFDIFIESVGKYGDVIRFGDEDSIRKLFNSNHQWKSNCKGGVLQYIEAFPEDNKLKTLTKYLD